METNRNITSGDDKKPLFDASGYKNVPTGFIIPGKTDKKDGTEERTDVGAPADSQGTPAQIPVQPSPERHPAGDTVQPFTQQPRDVMPYAKLSECAEEAVTVPKGASLLKVIGILLIVFGALSLVSSLTSQASMRMINNLAEEDPAYSQSLEIFGITDLKTLEDVTKSLQIVSVIVALVEIAAGIIGVKFCKDIEKAKLCLISGAVYTVCVIGEQIVSIFIWSSVTLRLVSLISLPFSLALPALFMLGAFRNMRSVKK